jgi:hypothetical protein
MSSLPSVVECQAQESLASVSEKEYKKVMAEFEALMKGMEKLIRARSRLFRYSSTYDGDLEDRVVSLESKSFHWTITSLRAVDCGWNANVTGIPSSQAKATSFKIAQSVAKAWREAVTAVKDELKWTDKIAILDEANRGYRGYEWNALVSSAKEITEKAMSQMKQVKDTMEAAIFRFRLLRVPPYFTSFTDM